MKKAIITIINIISAIPILIYPLVLAFSGMIFDPPGSLQSVLHWIELFVSVAYPIFIIACIILSRKKKSLLLALIALLPLLFLLYVFLFSAGLAQKDNYNTLNRDFICDSNSFLSVEKNGNFGGISLLEKKNFYTYENEAVGLIENNEINLMSTNPQEAKDLLSNCKNKEGQSLLDIYNLISN